MLILLLGFIGPFLFKLRTDGIFACPADGYVQNHYLAYCHVAGYGDYDHSAFWFGLEPFIEQHVKDADVLFLGSSRMQFGFSSQATQDWFTSSMAHYYLLGFTGTENITFTQPLLARMQPKARVYIINVDRFFNNVGTEAGNKTTKDTDAQQLANEKRFWQGLHKPLCSSFARLCGSQLSFFRFRETGAWKLIGWRQQTEAFTTMGQSAESEKTAWPHYAALGNQFLSTLPVDRHCVLLTLVPYKDTKLDEATAIASALQSELIVPQVESLRTFDGSHLDRPSAERWSSEFFQLAGPRIRRCLDNTAGAGNP